MKFLSFLAGKSAKSKRTEIVLIAVGVVILALLNMAVWKFFFYEEPVDPWNGIEAEIARLTDADIALFQAVRDGDAKLVLSSLNEGADAHAVGEHGTTPFKAAIALNRIDVIRLLVGAERGDNSEKWYSLLVYAVVHNRPLAVKELMKLSPDVNSIDKNGYTPLLYAIARNYVDVAKELLNAGADANAPGREGVSPLIVAVTRGRHDMVSELLKAGADWKTPSPSGETAMSIAQRRNRHSVMGLLMEAEASESAPSYEDYMKLPEDLGEDNFQT